MKDTLPSASPLFLREEEIRRGLDLLFFGYAALQDRLEDELGSHGLGSAHFRALYFIGRRDDQTVGEILTLLGVTKQSLGRVLQDLIAKELVTSKAGVRDRRQKLLRLTDAGRVIEQDLFARLREQMTAAYSQAGQGPVTGFWRVLEGLLEPDMLRRVIALQVSK